MRRTLLAVLLLSASGCEPVLQLSVARTVPAPADPDCARNALLRIGGIDSVQVGPVANSRGVGSEFRPWSRAGYGRVLQEPAGDSAVRVRSYWVWFGHKPADSALMVKQVQLLQLVDTITTYCADRASPAIISRG